MLSLAEEIGRASCRERVSAAGDVASLTTIVLGVVVGRLEHSRSRRLSSAPSRFLPPSNEMSVPLGRWNGLECRLRLRPVYTPLRFLCALRERPSLRQTQPQPFNAWQPMLSLAE